jgi:hypothetical protein
MNFKVKTPPREQRKCLHRHFHAHIPLTRMWANKKERSSVCQRNAGLEAFHDDNAWKKRCNSFMLHKIGREHVLSALENNATPF